MSIRRTIQRLTEAIPQGGWLDDRLEARLANFPKTKAHLIARSREAYKNTGEHDGEYGTYHHLAGLPPSKQQAGLEHALVHQTATNMGPDMAYDRTGKLTARVRKIVPNIVKAFEDDTLAGHMEKLVHGPQSDQYRHDMDKYY